MRTIGQVAHGRDNNFNLLRFVAALAVLVAHSVPISGRQPDYLAWWDRATGYTLGQVAVSVFFALSGFLITKSWCERQSLLEFAVARVLRIMPALIVCILLSVFILGPAVTTLPLSQYFVDPLTWSYLGYNLVLLAQRAWGLPGVFMTLPDNTVNGSLWTLRWEMACYGFVVLAGVLQLLRPRSALLVWLMPLVAIMLVRQSLSGILAGAALLTLPFATGGLIYLWRSRILIDGRIVMFLGVGVFLSSQIRHELYLILFALFVSYSCLWFGFVDIAFLKAFNRLGDCSYGLYIYAWPVRQIVALTGLKAWGITLLATPIAIGFAALSWHLVERPALAQRRRVAALLERRGARLPFA